MLVPAGMPDFDVGQPGWADDATGVSCGQVEAGLCTRLPLALRIAAERVAARGPVPLAQLTADLAASRPDCLDEGENRADVRAVFSWSCRQPPDGPADAFALLSLHPGTDLDMHAVAALTGSTAGQARKVLTQLYRASLIQAVGHGRYGMHDLLRAYAREQAAAHDTDSCCHQALTRLFDYYLSAARTELTTAVGLAAETGNAYQQACAHRELAESHHAAGQDDQACHQWRQALTLYMQLGAAETDQVRSQLAIIQAKQGDTTPGTVG
jgi:hypothetical protein